MKTTLPSFHCLAHCRVPAGLRPVGLGILVVIYSSELLFAANPQRGATRESAPTDELFQLGSGPIGVTCTLPAALWSYDLAEGQVQRAADAAGMAAADGLESPAYAPPEAYLPMCIISVIAAPFEAAISGIQASRERLPANKLTEVQAGLVSAMTNMSQQHHLRDAIIAVSQNNCPRRFVLMDDQADSHSRRDQNLPPGPILETSVAELRLEKLGSSDVSFALRIQARARLLRVSDHAVLRDTTYTYQTDPELFLDWALNCGEPFEKCTRTGYRQLASQIIADIIRLNGEAPLLVGSGWKTTSPKSGNLAAMFIKQRSNPIAPIVTVQLASQHVIESGSFFVIPSAKKGLFRLQKPLTRDEALSEARSDIEWAMDGLDVHPNLLVSLTTLTVMSPVAIYHETLGLAFHGVSKKTLRNANAPLMSAISNAQPSHALATQIVQQLGLRDFGNVVLLTTPGTDHSQLARAPTSTPPPILASWPGATSDNFRAGDKLLKIEVVKAALKGPAGSNPKLSVSIEARATLFNGSDGNPLYTCTTRYQGDARKYKAWAADDARLFRAELDHGYSEISTAALDEMIVRGWIRPAQKPQPTIADN